jgi:hypothetical protein
MRVLQGNPPWAISGSAMGLLSVVRHGPVSGDPPWTCLGIRHKRMRPVHRGNFSNWAARYGESAIPPLMGHPGLLI